MPRIPYSQLYPAMDTYPPKWVRSADGSRYEPDFSDYPENAPRWRVSHIDPLTGFQILELPQAEWETAEELEEVMADVVDAEPDFRAGTDEGAETEADAGATPDAA